MWLNRWYWKVQPWVKLNLQKPLDWVDTQDLENGSQWWIFLDCLVWILWLPGLLFKPEFCNRLDHVWFRSQVFNRSTSNVTHEVVLIPYYYWEMPKALRLGIQTLEEEYSFRKSKVYESIILEKYPPFLLGNHLVMRWAGRVHSSSLSRLYPVMSKR